MTEVTPNPARTEERLAVLGELAQIGLRLARAMEQHVVAGQAAQAHAARTDPDAMILPPVDLEGVARAFSRIGRAVRMTLALQAKLEQPARAPAPGPVRDARRSRAWRPDVGRLDRPDGGSPEDLRDAEDPLDLTSDEMLALICRDLGLSADRAAAFQAR
jgi:hypothetical protein